MSLVLSLRAPWALLGLVALVLLVPALRRVLGGGEGPALIPVLRDTGSVRVTSRPRTRWPGTDAF
jgi:1,4-dihydroxy-2-naphthoate octaprenyltransferase